MSLNRDDHTQGHGYMMQLIAHISIAAVVTMLLLVFLITNLTAIGDFLYQTGGSFDALQQVSLGSTAVILLFVLLGILIFSAVFLFLQRKMARDIETIANAVKQISEGDLSTHLALDGEGELTDIAENLNRMEEDIQELIRDGVPLQLNVECLTKPLRRKTYLEWIEKGYVAYLGSDIHMLGGYKDWEKARELLRRKMK